MKQVRPHHPHLQTVLNREDAAGKTAGRTPWHRGFRGFATQLGRALRSQVYPRCLKGAVAPGRRSGAPGPLYFGACGTVKVWFRYPCLFAGSSSRSAALPVRPKGTSARQTEMSQSTLFTCSEILFCMKKAFSVHELKFFFWKTSLSRKILNTEDFYPNLTMRTNMQILERAAACKIPTLKQLLDFGCH